VLKQRELRRQPPAAHKDKIMQQAEAVQTTRLQLVLAWSFAGIPLLAGVAQTLVNAMKLFQ
jgi:hypothetical protein